MTSCAPNNRGADSRLFCNQFRNAMKVLITDYAWPDLKVETGVIESAGFELFAGPAVSGDEEEIERLVAEHDPDAILACWAPLAARATTSPPRLKIVAPRGCG